MTKKSLFFGLLITFLLFRPSLTHAEARHSAEAAHYLSKAMAAYDSEDYGAAKTELALALEREPNFAEAYILKGLLLYHDDKVEEANAAFKHANDLNPRLSQEMRDHLEKQAHDVEQGLTQQDFSHFHIQFHGADQRSKAWESVGYLDEAYNYLGSCFGAFPPEKITVIIFTSEEFWEAWSAPTWLGGFFDKRDGKVRVRIDSPPGGDEEMKRRLRHEFTHAFIHQLYDKDLPLWFQEGVAQYYAYANPTDSFWKDTRLKELQKLTQGAPWMDMARIQEAIAKKNVSPGYIYLAYLESEALALYIAKDHGDSWVPSLLTHLREGSNFETAFQQTVGVTPTVAMEHLHQSWQ
jgi:tetratricopeptide (TPR) repeat protein